MPKRTDRINDDYVKVRADKVTEKDIGKVVRKADVIRKKAREGRIKRLLGDIELFLQMAKDYWTGEYREIPWWAISAIVFALLYFLNPLDLIPDFIPVVGYVDDIAVFTVCLAMVGKEIDKYRERKLEEGRE